MSMFFWLFLIKLGGLACFAANKIEILTYEKQNDYYQLYRLIDIISL